MTEQSSKRGRAIILTPLFVLLARVIVLLFNAGVVMILARYLSPTGFGHYAQIQGFATVLAMLTMGGSFIILIRELAREPANAAAYLGSGLLLQICLLALVFGSGLLLAPLLYHNKIVGGIRIVALSYAVLIPANLFSTVFVATRQAVYMALSTLAERLVYVAILTVLLLKGAGLHQILWAQVVSATAQLIFALWITVMRFVKPPWPFKLHLSKSLLRAAVPLSLSEGLRSWDQQLGVMLTEGLYSPAAAGLLGAPQRLMLRMTILPDSILRGLLPSLAQDKQPGRLGSILLRYLGTIALTIAAVAGPAGERLATTLFGTEYAAAGPVISILACSTVPLFVGYVFKYLLAAVGKQGYEVIGLVFGLLANGGSILLAVPRWGAQGAATAFLISQTVLCVTEVIILRRYRLEIQPKYLLRALPVLGALAWMVWMACQSPWWPLLTGVVSLAAIGILFWLKVFDLTELREYLSKSTPTGETP